MIFLGFDLSNAENRVLLMLTRDARMVELARSAPHEVDMHRENAAVLFDVPAERVTKEQRHLGKVISHGAQRGMKGRTLSDHILKELDVLIEPAKCERFIAAYFRKYAPVQSYFSDIRRQVLKYRALANTWGYVMRFDYLHLDDDAVFREAYSFLPQSEVAFLLNCYGFDPVYAEMMRRYGRPPNNHSHDSLLLSVPAGDAWDVVQFVRAHLERPRVYGGNELTIPVTVSVGSTWDMDVEFVRPPTRTQMEEAAQQRERKDELC